MQSSITSRVFVTRATAFRSFLGRLVVLALFGIVGLPTSQAQKSSTEDLRRRNEEIARMNNETARKVSEYTAQKQAEWARAKERANKAPSESNRFDPAMPANESGVNVDPRSAASLVVGERVNAAMRAGRFEYAGQIVTQWAAANASDREIQEEVRSALKRIKQVHDEVMATIEKKRKSVDLGIEARRFDGLIDEIKNWAQRNADWSVLAEEAARLIAKVELKRQEHQQGVIELARQQVDERIKDRQFDGLVEEIKKWGQANADQRVYAEEAERLIAKVEHERDAYLRQQQQKQQASILKAFETIDKLVADEEYEDAMARLKKWAEANAGIPEVEQAAAKKLAEVEHRRDAGEQLAQIEYLVMRVNEDAIGGKYEEAIAVLRKRGADHADMPKVEQAATAAIATVERKFAAYRKLQDRKKSLAALLDGPSQVKSAPNGTTAQPPKAK